MKRSTWRTATQGVPLRVLGAGLLALSLSACQSSGDTKPQEASAAGSASTSGTAAARSERCTALQREARLSCQERGRSSTQNTGLGGRTSPECMNARMLLQQQCSGG